jgi:hypothetical protein
VVYIRYYDINRCFYLAENVTMLGLRAYYVTILSEKRHKDFLGVIFKVSRRAVNGILLIMMTVSEFIIHFYAFLTLTN